MSTTLEIQQAPLWARLRNQRSPLSFELELTARCNNACRHCYINRPAGDRDAQAQELSAVEITRLADEAVALGALWCLLTGGEPLLRPDFGALYLALKRKGLLVSVFTNATLITAEHVRLFQRHPPRDIEVSVYGVTPATYERVTRQPGSFAAFMRGVDRLLAGGLRVRFKAMALRSNLDELPAIARFCRARTKDYFRFDPRLHLRYDGDAGRNAEIRAERLTAPEVVALERADAERFALLQRSCDRGAASGPAHQGCDHLFHCGAGQGSFSVSSDGLFRLCSDLWHPDCVYDLRQGTLADAWHKFVPRVRSRRSVNREILDKCHVCPMINLCYWCPARAHLETASLDAWVASFCELAHARAHAVGAGGDASLPPVRLALAE